MASVDVQQILAAGHRLDRRYLDEWVEALQVEDRWAEAQHDAG